MGQGTLVQYKEIFKGSDIEKRIRAEALLRLEDVAKDIEHKEFFNANKILLQGGWKEDITNTKGRPSKEEIHKETVRLANLERQLQEDYERINNGQD